MAESGKICVICGQDCSDRPRTRDMRGRLYCKTCYEQAREQQRLSKAHPPPISVAPPTKSDDIALEPLPARSPQRVMVTREQSASCPACGKTIATGATICMSCGFDTRTGHHVNVREARANAPLPPRDRAAWFMAPVYLFVKPSRFYRQFVVESAPLLTAFFAWMYGMAGVIDRIDSRVAMSQFSGRAATVPDDWGAHWAIIAIGGMLAGLLYSALGGWWYRVRLRWCSVPSPDWAMVRRVYLTSSVVFALPAVLWRGVQTGMYGKPSLAFNADPNLGDLLVLATLFLSIWISYVGVRTVFGAAKWRAILLFLALPGMLYGTAIAAVAVAGFLMAAAPPAIKAPLTHGSPKFTFSYPSNWDIDRTDPMFDPAGDVYVISPQNAAFHIMAYEAEGEPEDHLAWTTGGMRSALDNARDDGPLTEWAGMQGVGRVLRGEFEGAPSTIRMFVCEVKPGSFIEITESWADDDQKVLEPGFALIRSSFRRR